MKMKFKIISVILSVAIIATMIPYFTFAAEESPFTYTVTPSKTTVAPDEEVDVTVAITNYATAGKTIRGLQVDINNIDSSVFDIVSHSTCITDSTAASNMTSTGTSLGKPYVRFTYANMSGGLNTSTTNIMTMKLKAKNSLPAKSGSLTLPISIKTTTTDSKSFTQSYSLTENYSVPVSSISVNTPPSKVNYFTGQKFDPAGLVITANYTGLTSETVAYNDTTKSQFAFNPTTDTVLTTSNNKVTITYGGKSADQAITVKERSLTGIEVKTEPTKTTYVEGNKFDPTGLVITASYDNGTAEDISYNDSTKSQFTFSPDLNTALQSSNDKITISYGGKSVDQTISVKKLVGLAVKTQPSKTNYIEGNKFNPQGLVITASYNDGTTEDIAYNSSTQSQFTFTPSLDTELQTTDTKVTIAYGSKSVEQAITVSLKSLTEIAVKTKPTKTTYIEGNKLDLTGLVITASYNNDKTEDIAYNSSTKSQFTFVPSLDTELQTTDTKVTIEYDGKTAEQAITVNPKSLTGIAVKTEPTKTTYVEGDKFNPEGLVITASYDNGKTADIAYNSSVQSQFSFAPSLATELQASDNKVTVTYGGKAADQAITVKKLLTVTFDANRHGVSPDDQHVVEGNKIRKPTDPTETGYTFGGWYKEPGCATETSWNFDSDIVTENTTLYAKWTINSYTVTFNANGHGATHTDQKVDYEHKATRPIDPTAEGYAFKGWYSDSGLTAKWDFAEDIIEDNTTLYAKWDKVETVSPTDLNDKIATGGDIKVEDGHEGETIEITKPITPTTDSSIDLNGAILDLSNATITVSVEVTVTISGGEIKGGNNSQSIVNKGTLIIDATVSGFKSNDGAIVNAVNAVIILKPGTVISGNTNNNGGACNLMMITGSKIDMSQFASEELSANNDETTKVGITTEAAPTKGNPVTITEGADEDFSQYFFSDNANYVIKDEIIDGKHVVVLAVKDADPTPTPSTEYTITAEATEGGSISPSGNVNVEKGKNQTFTAKANEGYTFEKFIIDDKETVTKSSSYTFENVKENHTIEAVFVKKSEPQPEPTPVTTDGWKQTDGKWQYFRNGEALKDWHSDVPGWEGQWFYFDNTTGYAKSAWADDIHGWEGQWFYFNPNTCVMMKGWVNDGGTRFFYLDDNTGVMKKGWHFLNWSGGANWFYFDNNGSCLTNTTTPDGYYVNANGVWI